MSGFYVISRVVFLTNMSTTRAKYWLVIRTISRKSNLFLFEAYVNGTLRSSVINDVSKNTLFAYSTFISTTVNEWLRR